MRPQSFRFMVAFAALLVVALTLLVYRALPSRSFAADDFQWLVGAHTLSFERMLRAAFDPNQNHFYRPLVWVLFWLQANLFGLDSRAYHAVSLVLHLANVLLFGWLVCRLTNDEHATPAARLALFAIPAALVALHPAPFEAVVWVSAQSELLAALWLLLMLHFWRSGFNLLAALALLLAVLTKESAVIGIGLLVLMPQHAIRSRQNSRAAQFLPFVLPALITLAYLVIQVRVERENYLVDQGGYGFGTQVLLNPLRGLALLVAPLPNTEHANNAWLVPLGAAVALLLVFALVRGTWPVRRAVLALGFTLLPTAPFAAPPNSRYLYVPVMAGALLLALVLRHVIRLRETRPRWLPRFAPLLVLLALAVGTGYALELSSREAGFAVGSGADGSLWRVASATCTGAKPDRMIILNAPLAEIHARALLKLACGSKITPIFVDSMEIAEANLEPNSLIIDFPDGAARIAKRT